MLDHPIPLPLKGDHLFIDNSSMNSYFQCPRMGAYSYSLKRKPASPSPALIFGGAIHEALEVRYRTHHDKKMIDEAVTDDMIAAFSDYYDEHATELDVSEYRNLSYGISTILEYCTKNRYEQPNTHYLNGEPCVEIPFALPVGQFDINDTIWVTDPDLNNGDPTTRHVGTITIWLTGKIDMIVRKHGGLWLLDHKTSSMGGAGFTEEFQTSTQFKGYAWAAEQLLGQHVLGVIINALICRKPKRDGSINFEFYKESIPLAREHVSEWRNTFLTAVSTFITQHIDQTSFTSPEQSFPMQTSWCKGKYGRCKFFDVCTLVPAQRQAMLYSGIYTDDTWSPIAEEERVNLGDKSRTDITLPELPDVFPLA